MKKIALSVLLSALCLFNLNGQSIKAGVKGGMNVSNQDMLGAAPSPKGGYHAGIFAAKMFSDQYGIQAEILFSTQGSDHDSYDIDMNYFNVPLLFRYQASRVFSFQLGPQLGLLSSVDGRIDHNKSVYKTVELSGVVGVEAQLPVGVLGGVRYNHGVTDMWDDPNWPGKSLNRVLQIYVGYQLFNRS